MADDKQQFFYGGQAVIEGVMMRGRRGMAIAVRKTDGKITAKEDDISSITDRWPFLKWPFVRGTFALFDAMIVGMKALQFSAAEFAEEEEEEMGPKEMALTIAVSLLFTVGLFIVLPAFLLRFFHARVASDVLLNFIEGGIKLTVFIGYVVAISRLEDIRRVFQYHGAEHKAINCYEAGQPLTVARVRDHSLIHRRCGTSFIVFVLMTSIFIFSFFGRPPFVQRILLHLALLPVVAGISYEIIRAAGRDNSPWIVRLISKPGMWTQRLTTREPDDGQIEVAIHALQLVLERDLAEAERVEEAPESPGVLSGVHT